MSTDDAFAPYWLDETDWLVTLCMLPKDEGEDQNLAELNWIGRLFGFAQFTNTRILALVGDPDVPAYEILFSFDTPEHRREFLDLVGRTDMLTPMKSRRSWFQRQTRFEMPAPSDWFSRSARRALSRLWG